MINNNPAQNLETPKLDKRLPKYLSLDDSKKLLTVTESDENDENKERDYAIITLFLNCGLRLSELIGINLQDINYTLSFNINIVNNQNEKFIYNMKLNVDLSGDDGGIYKGYLYDNYTTSGSEYEFFKAVK